MYMTRKPLLLIVVVLISSFCFSQVKVGQWKDYLSYNSCNTVAKAGNVVFVSNGAGLIEYNISDNSITPLNKIYGLSDIGITLLRYNPYNGTLLIVYNNANIDILKNGTITNFPDIKLKTITGKKNINEVTFKNNLAYLACGFGIVVFDTDKLEIKDSYIIGPGASYLNVYQVGFTDTTLFAATSIGLLKANQSTLLNNFQNWKTVNSIPTGVYNGVVRYKNKIMTNYSYNLSFATPTNLQLDTIYSYDGISWSKDTIKKAPYFINKMLPNGNYFTVIDQFGYEVFNPSEQRIAYITQYSFGYAGIEDVSADFSNPQYPLYWIADFARGFIESKGPYPYYPNTKISMNGMNSNYIGNISVNSGTLISAPVKVYETGAAHYSKEGLNYYDGSDWQYIKEYVYDTIMDLNYSLIDKKDHNHFWASSWVHGLVEYKNKQLFKVYNNFNSPIPYLPGFPTWHRVAGLSQDEKGNLWIGSSDVKNFLTVRKTDGTFQNFNFSSIAPAVGKVLADKNNQVWVLFPRGDGIAVYENNNFGTPNASNTKFLTSASGNGKLPSQFVYAIAEDLDGHIWIGTDVGIGVFYNPANVVGGTNFDCQQILITQDNTVQILLGTQKVNAIAVDGANRKWVGTETSGVFCFSPDGQQQIYHFTTDNSPIFSNSIIDLAYDDVNGDVYIGSDQGMQSYRTSIIKGAGEYNGVHAYPNPVKPGYSGSVYVRGLVDQSVVKITDLSGNLVWEAKSQGGQIEWPVKNLKGQRVASGVYFAYCAVSDGTKSAVTKIMVIN